MDGKSIAGLAIDEVVKRVSGPLGSAVTLTVDREGKDLDFTLHRQQIVLPTVKGHDRNGNDSWNYFVSQNPEIAYMPHISQFDENTFDEMKNVLDRFQRPKRADGRGHAGVDLDLRFNPGGQLQQAINVVNLFIKDGVIVTTRRAKFAAKRSTGPIRRRRRCRISR